MIKLFPEQTSPMGVAVPPAAADTETATLETRIAELEASAAGDVARAQDLDHANSERATLIHELQGQAQRAVNAAAAAPSMARLAAMSASIEADTAQAAELRKSAELKTKEATALQRQIGALRCAPLAARRRELLIELIPIQVETARRHAELHSIEHKMREHGAQFPAAAWHELGFAGGDQILVQTWFSKWLDSRGDEDFAVPDSHNESLHIPKPTAFYAELAVNESHARYAASCGARGGYEAGRARAAQLAHR